MEPNLKTNIITGFLLFLLKPTGYSFKDYDKELVLLSEAGKGGHFNLCTMKFLKANGLPEAICTQLGLGAPLTSLDGRVAFTVHDENGNKVAQYGIDLKDGKPIFPRSFNPGKYLYGYHAAKHEPRVFLTNNMIECIKLLCKDNPAVCNFELPYLSEHQIELLNELDHIVLWTNNDVIRSQAMNSVLKWLHFI